MMKKIDAVIRNTRFYSVKDALYEIGVKGMTVYEIKGMGNQRGTVSSTPSGRPGSFKQTELIPKTKIEIVCDDCDVQKIVDTIVSNAHTGHVGDGKIFLSNVTNVIRIRTGESGTDAI